MLRRQLLFFRLRWFSFLSFLLLDNQASGRLRAALLRLNGARIGERCFVRGGLRMQEGFNVTLGDDVFINNDCFFDTSAPITIGNRVQFGYGVTLATGDHHVGTHECRCGGYNPRPIVIGDGAWIGAKATLFPGVTIGEGAVVMGCAVVGIDVPPDTMVGGFPARPIRKLEPGGAAAAAAAATSPTPPAAAATASAAS